MPGLSEAQRKVDTSEKGPDSWGHGRKRSRRSPSRRLGLPERRVSNSGKVDKHTSTPKTMERPNGEASTQVILQPQSPFASPQTRGVKKIKRDEGMMMNKPVTQRHLEESQVVVQPSSATPEPDFKRRKRARCGTCSGCMNRDKTQDCRQCRNCLDQK